MKRFFQTAIALGLSLSTATPAFGYSLEQFGTERMTRRAVIDAAEVDNRVDGVLPAAARTRRPAMPDMSGRKELRRAQDRAVDVLDPALQGERRYRRLLRPNTRNLRKSADLSTVPDEIVETGPRHPGRASQMMNHRPSRRSILQEAWESRQSRN